MKYDTNEVFDDLVDGCDAGERTGDPVLDVTGRDQNEVFDELAETCVGVEWQPPSWESLFAPSGPPRKPIEVVKRYVPGFDVTESVRRDPTGYFPSAAQIDTGYRPWRAAYDAGWNSALDGNSKHYHSGSASAEYKRGFDHGMRYKFDAFQEVVGEGDPWYKHLFGAVHTAGGAVLSLFGLGGAAKSLGEAESSANILPEWADPNAQQKKAEREAFKAAEEAAQPAVASPSTVEVPVTVTQDRAVATDLVKSRAAEKKARLAAQKARRTQMNGPLVVGYHDFAVDVLGAEIVGLPPRGAGVPRGGKGKPVKLPPESANITKPYRVRMYFKAEKAGQPWITRDYVNLASVTVYGGREVSGVQHAGGRPEEWRTFMAPPVMQVKFSGQLLTDQYNRLGIIAILPKPSLGDHDDPGREYISGETASAFDDMSPAQILGSAEWAEIVGDTVDVLGAATRTNVKPSGANVRPSGAGRATGTRSSTVVTKKASLKLPAGSRQVLPGKKATGKIAGKGQAFNFGGVAKAAQNAVGRLNALSQIGAKKAAAPAPVSKKYAGVSQPAKTKAQKAKIIKDATSKLSRATSTQKSSASKLSSASKSAASKVQAYAANVKKYVERLDKARGTKTVVRGDVLGDYVASNYPVLGDYVAQNYPILGDYVAQNYPILGDFVAQNYPVAGDTTEVLGGDYVASNYPILAGETARAFSDACGESDEVFGGPEWAEIVSGDSDEVFGSAEWAEIIGDAAADLAKLQQELDELPESGEMPPAGGGSLTQEEMFTGQEFVPLDGVKYTETMGPLAGAVGSYRAYFGIPEDPRPQGLIFWGAGTNFSDPKQWTLWYYTREGKKVKYPNGAPWADEIPSDANQYGISMGSGPLIGDPSGKFKNLQFAIKDKAWFWRADVAPTWATAETRAAIKALQDERKRLEKDITDLEKKIADKETADRLASEAKELADLAHGLKVEEAEGEIATKRREREEADFESQYMRKEYEFGQEQQKEQGQIAIDEQRAMLDYFRQNPEAAAAYYGGAGGYGEGYAPEGDEGYFDDYYAPGGGAESEEPPMDLPEGTPEFGEREDGAEQEGDVDWSSEEGGEE